MCTAPDAFPVTLRGRRAVTRAHAYQGHRREIQQGRLHILMCLSSYLNHMWFKVKRLVVSNQGALVRECNYALFNF